MNLHPITGATAYNDQRYLAILGLEERGNPHLAPYNDLAIDGVTTGYVSIGIGFNLHDPTIRSAIFAKLGYTNPQLLAALNTYVGLQRSETKSAIQAALNSIVNAYLPGQQFAFPSATPIKELFEGTATTTGLVKGYEDQVDRWARNNAIVNGATATLANSKERLVLLSLAYNGVLSNSPSLARAIKNDNRAEAWFEIRYNTNGGQNRPGVATRRFVEAELFGLYDDPANVSADESKTVFSMLAKHRDEILAYEALFGILPYGTPTPGNRIDAAIIDASLFAIAVPDKLYDALKPARDAFVAWVNMQLPAGETPLVAADWNSAAIAYNSPTQPQPLLNARALDGLGNGMDKNLLVGNDIGTHLFGGLGNDVLVGGIGDDILQGDEGDDILYGGAGMDTYVFRLGDGVQHDRIVDSDGRGRIIVINALGDVINDVVLQRQGTTNAWTGKNPDGTIAVTISHNSPWRLTLNDGSVIALGEGFDPAGFGMTLQEEAATATTTYSGDFIKQTNVEGTAWLRDADGNYVNGGAQSGAADQITGSSGADLVRGLLGDDALLGRAGDDVIEGGDGNDVLMGGSGADTLDGGDGNDYLAGGAGDDKYVFDLGDSPLDGLGFTEVIVDNEGSNTVSFGSAIDAAALQFAVVDGVQYLQIQYSANDFPLVTNDGGGTVQNYQFSDDTTQNLPQLIGRSGSASVLAYGAGSVFAALGGSIKNSFVSTARFATLPVGRGDEYLVSACRDDALHGGGGKDSLCGGVATDIIDGGTGRDDLFADEAVTLQAAPASDLKGDSLEGSGSQMIQDGMRDAFLNGRGQHEASKDAQAPQRMAA